ncbi:MAG: fused MFS/spermidine synthase [Pirellulales bacterium]
MRPTPPALPAILLLALVTFASGCAAIVFQVAWMRELRLVFGATTAAVAAVLAIFMAGLGLGSAVLGKWADRVANPLRMYGTLEIAIALSAAASPWLVDLASALYIRLGGQESLGLAGATAIRLALAAAVMAVPTFLMGGTLPAAVRSVTRVSDDHRRALGVLYGANALGAVFGAAVATFFALEQLGTRATLWAGCAIGLCAGAIAVARSRQLAPLTGQDDNSLREGALRESTKELHADYRHAELGFRPRIIYLTAAVLGFTFFALELVWYRMLGPILGGTAFTFGLILCVALFGIGVGGLAYNFVFRKLQPTWSALAVTCGCEALLIMIPYALGDRLALMAAWRSQSATSFGALVLGWTYVTAIVVLPVALVSGLQFPLLIALLGHGRQAVSRHLGLTYAWNTLGAIAGSLIAGFGGLPLLTAPGMWLAIALLLAMLSLGVLFAAPRTDRRAAALVTGLAILTTGAMFARGPTAAWRHGGIGAGRSSVPPKSQPNPLQRWLNQARRAVRWQADGIESSVAINEEDSLAFVVNGKVDGNAVNDAATQVGMAVLGAVLHGESDKPMTALVIGLGTGESAGWLAQMPNFERVDVVELEPAIDEMASRCSALNWDVLHHPRVRRIYNDGREFVFTTANKYDVILSEPSNPYRAGIASLYTTEFYQAVRKRLNPGGVFVQWVQAYEISDSTVGTVLATVGAQFEHVELWQTLPSDLQLVCSVAPLNYTAKELRIRIGSGTVKEALAKCWSVYDLEGFLAHFVAGPEFTKEMAGAPFLAPNSDDRTALEYGFAKTVGRMTPFSVELVRDRLRERGIHRPTVSDDSIDWDQVELKRQIFNALYSGPTSGDLLTKKPDLELVMAFAHFADGNHASAVESWPTEYLDPSDVIQRLMLAKCYAELARPECLELIAAEAERHPTEAAAIRAAFFYHKKDWGEAARYLNEFLALAADNPWLVPHMIDDVFLYAIEVAKADPTTAERLYERLTPQFTANCCGYPRRIARVLVAGQLSPQHVIDALADIEPNVVWTADILKLRAESYRAANHPLAARAQSDWERFQRNRMAK